jgi:hypothetical protein
LVDIVKKSPPPQAGPKTPPPYNINYYIATNNATDILLFFAKGAVARARPDKHLADARHFERRAARR